MQLEIDDTDATGVVFPPRRGRGKSQKSIALAHAAYDILNEIHPATVPTVEQINLEHQLANSKANEAVQHATNCGLMLLQIKASKQHGEWLPWLNGEIESGRLKVKARQTRSYMQLASNWQRDANLVEAPSIRAALELLSDKEPDEQQGTLIDVEAERQARAKAEAQAEAERQARLTAEQRNAEWAAMWDSIDERIEQATKYYRRDNWQEQPNKIEVWSEKGTVRGTIWPVLSAYGVTFRVMHGFGSATTLNNVAKMSACSKKPLTVLYVGDFDCSGMCMSEVDIPQRIDRYNGKMDIRRIALTADDVNEKDSNGDPVLPRFEADTKTGDSRYKWFVNRYGNKCVELDAMSPVVLRERVESAIVELLDMDAWNHAKAIEDIEVASMRDYQQQWKESISRLAEKYSEVAP